MAGNRFLQYMDHARPVFMIVNRTDDASRFDIRSLFPVFLDQGDEAQVIGQRDLGLAEMCVTELLSII
jgi:hypothetical protein